MSDRKDFSHIYITYYARMKRFAREYVVLAEDAENIVQDVFLELWGNWDRMQDSANLFAYLYLAVKNRSIDFLRRRSVSLRAEEHITREYRLTLQLNYEALTAFDDVSSAEELERMLNEALSALPERCRQIFVMSKLEGRKQYEIARTLGISVNTVESQMAIAYRKLRAVLKNYSPLLLFLLGIR
ncbi:RNA polymerase sigma-70 factor [Alistipes provencensis]|uniref:RNA polymerase sigma-70 factor n=1 Tax=Alistipes provencensis TaxID=1816676 RepID=UPI0007ED74AA|nr:RNA polymerase sigma-70 factor [Alistipes provencensis]